MKLVALMISLAMPFSGAMAQGVHPERENAPLPTIMSQAHADLSVPKSIRDTPIYIYSFLDFRKAEYTRKVLDTINNDLTGRLKALNITSKILEFRDTPQGEFYSDSFAAGHSSTALPVRSVIIGNAESEAASGATLRLVIFPARYELVGAWRYYDIRWLLFVVGNNEPFFDYTYSGKHLVMWSNGENADARSKKILDAVFDELKERRLI